MYPRELQLLISLGILDARADEVTAFMVFGKLIWDPILLARTREWDAANPILEFGKNGRPFPAPYQAIHDVVAAMTPQEKRALAERVIAKCA